MAFGPLRKENGWELWPSCHPVSVGCVQEGRSQCTCRYHIVNDDRTTIESFGDFPSAEQRFCERAGGIPMVMGKTIWSTSVSKI